MGLALHWVRGGLDDNGIVRYPDGWFHSGKRCNGLMFATMARAVKWEVVGWLQQPWYRRTSRCSMSNLIDRRKIVSYSVDCCVVDLSI